MLPLLPPELISKIVVYVFAQDKNAIGSMGLVSHDWKDLMDQPFIWMTIAMEFHSKFFSDYQDKVNLLDTMQLWNEPNLSPRDHGLMIDWKLRVTEWELIEEIMAISTYFFQEPFVRRLSTADLVAQLCRSSCVSVESLLEFIPSPRSDLRVSAGIGIREKFLQITEAYPQYLNTIPEDEPLLEEAEMDSVPPFTDLSPTAVQKLMMAKRTESMCDSVELLAESFEMIMIASQNGTNFADIEFPPMFQTVMDYIVLLLEDRASRVSFRGIECIAVAKPLCILFYERLVTLKTHYNPAVAHKAESILKSLKKPKGNKIFKLIGSIVHSNGFL